MPLKNKKRKNEENLQETKIKGMTEKTPGL